MAVDKGASYFDVLLAHLHPDPGRAAEMYVTIQDKLITKFLSRGLGGTRAEACAVETLERVARRLAAPDAEKVENIVSYIHGFANFVMKEAWREPQQEGLDSLAAGQMPATPTPAPGADDEALREACLKECMAKLPVESATLILEYHDVGKGAQKIERRKQIAEQLGITADILKKRIYRLKGSLTECFKECGRRQATP